MKNKNKPQFRYLVSAVLVAFFAAALWSCKDDDPSLADLRNDKITYLADSLRISDSLKRVNAAGVVNYAINVVSGSTSTLYSNYDGVGRTKDTKAVVADAIVTISQFGKIVKDTTDASGMVVFNGFFRSAVNVTIEKAGFTTISYISAVSISDSTENNSINFVGNIIPIFETTGANTATISGRVTIQTDLTNKNREFVPDGTTVTASIDATSSAFDEHFLTNDLVNGVALSSNSNILYIGEILQAAYSTGVIGSVTGGNYTITVPSAIDGLPLNLEYSEIAADQKLFEQGAVFGDRIATYRTLFLPNPFATISSVPAGVPVTVTLESFTTAAAATATVTAGAVSGITLGVQGSGYIVAPIVQIIGSGTGAAATAVLTDGRVTAINMTSNGTGYTAGTTTVNLLSGVSATAYASVTDGAISAITVSDGGFNFTVAPRVIITSASSLGGGATATATIAGGKVTAVTVNTGGTGYLDGNSAQESFSTTKDASFNTKTGLKYINDIHYGTGLRQPN